VTRFLLDVNVLIALIDRFHVQHDRAHDWFATSGREAWATCPLTENGVLRIVSHPRYPNSPGSPAEVVQSLKVLRTLGSHEFWPDDITLFDPDRFDSARLLASGQITDTYLLGLASAHEGKLATFDRHLVTDAVANGEQSLHLIL